MIRSPFSHVLLITIFLAVMCPWLALADTDYRCLTLCVNNGKPESVCMPQCSVDHTTSTLIPGEIVPPTAPPLANHRVLSPLQPVDPTVIVNTSKLISPYRETKNYQCIMQCLQNKMQYDTCERGCTTVTLDNGDIVGSSKSTVGSNVIFTSPLNPKTTPIKP